jgi:hypothetical protein
MWNFMGLFEIIFGTSTEVWNFVRIFLEFMNNKNFNYFPLHGPTAQK